jgi:hypothetical protein
VEPGLGIIASSIAITRPIFLRFARTLSEKNYKYPIRKSVSGTEIIEILQSQSTMDNRQVTFSNNADPQQRQRRATRWLPRKRLSGFFGVRTSLLSIPWRQRRRLDMSEKQATRGGDETAGPNNTSSLPSAKSWVRPKKPQREFSVPPQVQSPPPVYTGVLVPDPREKHSLASSKKSPQEDPDRISSLNIHPTNTESSRTPSTSKPVSGMKTMGGSEFSPLGLGASGTRSTTATIEWPLSDTTRADSNLPLRTSWHSFSTQGTR